MPTLGPETVIVVQPPAAPVVTALAPLQPAVIVVPTPGPPGPTGPPGSGSAVYVQGTAASTWTVNTSLGRKPYSVMVNDSAGNEIYPDVTLPSTTQIVITFATPQTGSVSYT